MSKQEVIETKIALLLQALRLIVQINDDCNINNQPEHYQSIVLTAHVICCYLFAYLRMRLKSL